MRFKKHNITRKLKSTEPKKEKALLVGVDIKGHPQLLTLTDSLQELKTLAISAGATVIGTIHQNLNKPTNSYLGKGKLQKLKTIAKKYEITTIICDDELTPLQQRNFEKALEENSKVIDRTALILDVFSRRAKTREGRLQVELAQHQYLLPRLAGQWSHLERLGGGIGTRGPGETQIETDRRLVRGRIQKISKSLDNVRRHRQQYRSRRSRLGSLVASIVGYTNAGKSTLLNALTGANLITQNKLFSTLDPTTRRINLPSGRNILVTDTVGFIQKLPTSLIAAFRATLEEIKEANLLLHIVDITHQNALAQAEVVSQILGDLGIDKKPTILVFNKIDQYKGNFKREANLIYRNLDIENCTAVLTSAKTKQGLTNLLNEMDETINTKHLY